MQGPALAAASLPFRSGPQAPLSPQSPETTQSSSEMSQPSCERIQHVLLSQASAAAQQQQPPSRTQPTLLPAFPPRRPLRHQPPSQFTQPHLSQPRLPTSPTSSAFFSSSGGVPSNPIPTVSPTFGTAAQIPAIAGAAALFDGVWRGMLERVYSELAHVHTIYAGALRKEQQEKEIFRAHCVRLKGERDLAREKLRRAFGRKYDDGAPIQVLDVSAGPLASSSSETVDERMRTPPLSASSVTSNFPSASSPVLSAAHVSGEVAGNVDSSPQQRTSELVDVHPYPSPSPSCSSPPPPPPRSPIAHTIRPLLSQERSSCLVQRSACAGEAATTLDDLNGAQRRKRECVENEDEDGRSAKRQRSRDVEDPDEPTCSQGDDASVAEDGKPEGRKDADTDTDTGGPYEDVQRSSEEEAGEDVASLLPAETSKRWNVPFDLMFMLTEEKVVCRVCAYKHGRGGGPSPVAFSRSTTWEELTAHCERQHPAACAEVSMMGPREVMELRHRMTMIANGGAQ